MSFQPEPGVKAKRSNDYSTYKFVGYSANAGNVRFTVLNYGFCNPISASMFDYLRQQPDIPWDAAQQAVTRFEQILNPTGAMKAMYEVSASNAVFAIPQVGVIVEAGAKAMQAAGGLVTTITIDFSKHTAKYNPHKPDLGRTWTGTKVDQYVNYAVAYYKARPREGPAYKLMRENR